MDLRERRLVRRLQQRDESAFRELLRLHQTDVFNLVYRMLGNYEEAQDLAQDVFVTVFKSIDSFRGDSKFSTWLYRVAVNTCKNRYKYLTRRHYHTMQPLDATSEKGLGQRDGGPQVPLHAAISEPDKILEGLETERALQQAIASMDEEQRLLIVLRDVKGLSYREIVRITGLAEGTIKSRLHRARLTLKELLKKHM